MFSIEFFTDSDGSSPIASFLKRCNSSQEAKILRQLKYIEEFGFTQAVPSLKKLAGTKLWELRILGKDSIRVVCTPTKQKTIIVLYIFFKKKQKTPATELKTALDRFRTLLP